MISRRALLLAHVDLNRLGSPHGRQGVGGDDDDDRAVLAALSDHRGDPSIDDLSVAVPVDASYGSVGFSAASGAYSAEFSVRDFALVPG